ncbi:SDR family oxidoreductase [Azospirillum sp. ST 5-10]|uniref:SDR family oxidoreductase n=1 Tax=unclassified Azospirillum TaxID=2630922 RepID=UPI003F4A45F5
MILVSGATGQCGGGVAVALHRRGLPVRALTRRPDGAAAAALRAQGIAVAGGDMLRPDTLAPAFAGVDRAFLVTTPAAGFDEEIAAGRAFVAAAAAAGVRHLLFQSVVYADTPIPHCATKGAIEALIRAAGIGHTIARVGYFVETLDRYVTAEALRTGRIVSVTAPHTPIHWTSVADIGAAAATLLAADRPWNRRFDVVAPVPRSMADVVGTFAEAVGRPFACDHHPVSYRTLFAILAEQNVLRRDKAEAFLAALPDPDADYYAAVGDAAAGIGRDGFAARFGLRLRTPDDHVRALAARLVP